MPLSSTTRRGSPKSSTRSSTIAKRLTKMTSSQDHGHSGEMRKAAKRLAIGKVGVEWSVPPKVLRIAFAPNWVWREKQQQGLGSERQPIRTTKFNGQFSKTIATTETKNIHANRLAPSKVLFRAQVQRKKVGGSRTSSVCTLPHRAHFHAGGL